MWIIFAIFFWGLFFIASSINKKKDDNLTKASRNGAKENNLRLTYFDYSSNCTRSITTGEKCVQLWGKDVNGDTFTYVFTKPRFGKGRVIDLQYYDVNRKGEQVKVKREQMRDWINMGAI